MLVSTGYVSVALDERMDQDVVGTTESTNEPVNYEPSTTTGYGRVSLGASTAVEDDVGNLATIDTTDITFAGVSSGAGIIGAMLIYAELVANDSSGRRLISAYESGWPKTPNGGNLDIAFSTAGWLNYATTS